MSHCQNVFLFFQTVYFSYLDCVDQSHGLFHGLCVLYLPCVPSIVHSCVLNPVFLIFGITTVLCSH